MSTIQVNTSQSLNIGVNQTDSPPSSSTTVSTPNASTPSTNSTAIPAASPPTPTVVVNSTVITGGKHHEHGSSEHLRYAFFGAAAFQPPPPPIAPRIEKLPAVIPAPTPATLTTTPPSALESLQETVKTLTTTMMQMMDKLKEIITGVAANKNTLQSASAPSSALPAGAPLSRGMKFEYRAHSGKDGKLVVLIPKSMNNATDVKILSPDRSQVLATGHKDGLTADKQAQIRFDQVGEAYPAGSIVQFTDSHGKVWEVTVPNTAGRFQY